MSYLTILKVLGKGVYKKVLCRCDCGKEKIFFFSNIVPKPNARFTSSCGCKRSELVSNKNTKHAMTGTKFYKRWRSMFDRLSPKYICAKDYVGIKICPSWYKFENFLKDMFALYEAHKEKYGERQTTLDRINPFGNYEPENCRWATFSEQNRNTKKNFVNRP